MPIIEYTLEVSAHVEGETLPSRHTLDQEIVRLLGRLDLAELIAGTLGLPLPDGHLDVKQISLLVMNGTKLVHRHTKEWSPGKDQAASPESP